MKKLFLALMAIAAIALTGCEKDSDSMPEEKPTSEKVETISATNITSSGALLTGQIGVEIADYKSVEFGMLISQRESDVSSYEGEKLVGDKLVGQTFSVTANGLFEETQYYYRAYLILNNMQYVYGDIKSFKTEDALLPTVTTTEVTNVSSYSATCGGNVSDDGGAAVTERGICYSASEIPSIRNSKVSGGSGKGAFIVNLSSLKENTTYYVRAYATNANGTTYGNTKSFKTEKQSLAPSKDVEAVDLGLSVKWANMNIGATKPEEYGAYFAWGETSPKTTYNWSTYFDTKDGGSTFIKYNNEGGKTTLELEDDAAHVNWGGAWRMPTCDELNELKTQCTWTWTTQNGVKGYQVKGKNGNSIFLPVAGYRSSSDLYNGRFYGYYWSSSLYSYYSYNAYLLFFGSDDVHWSDTNRYIGQSVRPVCQ